MNQEQKNQVMYEENYCEEEKGVSFIDIIGVLFGRKLLFLIVVLSCIIAGTIAVLWLNKQKSTYEGMYNYYVTGLSEGTYVDGSRFDVRDLITLEKLNQYKEENEELKDLDMDTVYYDSVIKSLKYETIYKENKAKMNDKDNDYVVDKAGYVISLKKKYLTKIQAQVLTKAIANEANVISQKIVDNADYTQYLTLYVQSTIYENQITYLEGQYNLISGKYENLIEQYGDVVLSNGLRLSDVRLQMQEYFQNISFGSLREELAYNGYVKDYTNYTMQIEKQIENLQREKAVDTNKKNELISQRDALLNAAGQLQSVELTAYNDQIISFTNRIFDIDEEIELLTLKLNNKNRELTDAEYASELNAFNGNLEAHYNKLSQMTDDYTTNEKEVVKKYSVVYFDSNSIVAKQNGVNIVLYMAVVIVGSLFVGMFVNLCLDGKKLSNANRKEE